MLRHWFRMCFEVVDSHTFGMFSVSQYLSLLLALISNGSRKRNCMKYLATALYSYSADLMLESLCSCFVTVCAIIKLTD